MNLYDNAPLRLAPSVKLRLLRGDVISDSIAYTGVYEASLTAALVVAARRGGLMVDIGANLGYYSLLWVSQSSLNQCIAVEPSPRNLCLLRHNLEVNQRVTQVQVVAAGAGAATGHLTFDVGPAGQTGWGGFSNVRSETTIDVNVVRVDDLVGPSQRIALLKIDVEGADTWVLQGCEQLLRQRRIDSVYFEQNLPRMHLLGIEQGLAQAFLTRCGYSVKGFYGRGHLSEWVATPA